MRCRPLVFALLIGLAACGDNLGDGAPDGGAGDGPSADAASDAPADAAADAPPVDAPIDAPPIDAPLTDAAVDAPPIDASLTDAAVDVPAIDAPLADAAVDAPPTDAAVDAPLPPLGGAVVGLRYPTMTTSQLVRVPLDGGPAIELTPAAGRVYEFVRSPDGTLLVYRDSGGLHAVRADGTAAPYLLAPPLVGDYAFSPAGDRIAYDAPVEGTRSLFTVRPDGTGTVVVSGARAVDSTWAWRPHSDRLWFRDVTSPGFGSLAETCADHACLRVIDPAASVTAFTFSPDGSHAAWTRLIANGPTETLTFVDVATDQRTVVASGHSYGFNRWSPDGTRLAFISFDSGVPGTNHVIDADGTDLVTLALPFVAYSNVSRWSPDSRYLLDFIQRGTGQSSTLHLFVFCADGTCREELEVPQDHLVVSEVWSPDNRVVRRVIVPGHPGGVLVADCPQAACARTRVSGNEEQVYPSPVWASGSSRYAFDSANGIFVADAIGAPPRMISPLPGQVIRFDAAGTRVLVSGAGAHLHALRVDGTEDLDLGPIATHHLELY